MNILDLERTYTEVEREEWRPVPFATSYQASSHGRIINSRRYVLSPALNHRDYLVLDLNKIQYRLNRVICITFHGEPPSPQHQAAHKDSDKSNNYANNLYWATALQNSQDLYKTGVNNGENSFMAILKEADVLEIRRLASLGIRPAQINKSYPHVCRATVSHIIHRRSWKHLP